MNKLLYFKIEGIVNFENGIFEFDFINQKTARSNDGELFPLFDSIYIHNVLSLVGINSSGKTTAAKLIYWVINTLGTSSIGSGNSPFLNITDLFEDEISLSVIAYSKKFNTVFRYVAKINKTKKSFLEIISDHVDYRKDKGKINRKNIYEFNNFVTIEREDIKQILQKANKEKYIISSYEFKDSETILRFTEFFEKFDTEFYRPDEFIRVHNFEKLSNNLLHYLDKSIDYISKIEEDTNDTSSTYELKFKNRESFKTELFGLRQKLSTGTVRWISLFNFAVEALEQGSYFIVDELELSLHKALSIDLIRLFNSKVTNPKGATLIFTTHYTELLDSLKRLDSIYVTSKAESGFSRITNLSKLIGRNDLSKSDYYLKNFTKEQTAPSREIFNELVDEVIARVGKK